MRVLAFNLQYPLFLLPEVDRYRKVLQFLNTVLIDRFSKSSVGSIDIGVESELSNRQTQIVGIFSLSSELVAEGSKFIMSDRNFLRYFSLSNPNLSSRILQEVDIGVIKVKEGMDIAALVAGLRQTLSDDVTILSKEDFLQRELTYWQKTTSVGFVFNMLAGMSFAVEIKFGVSDTLYRYCRALAGIFHFTSKGLSQLLSCDRCFTEGYNLNRTWFYSGFINLHEFISLSCRSNGVSAQDDRTESS